MLVTFTQCSAVYMNNKGYSLLDLKKVEYALVLDSMRRSDRTGRGWTRIRHVLFKLNSPLSQNNEIYCLKTE